MKIFKINFVTDAFQMFLRAGWPSALDTCPDVGWTRSLSVLVPNWKRWLSIYRPNTLKFLFVTLPYSPHSLFWWSRVFFELSVRRRFAGSINRLGELNQKSRLTVKGNMHPSSIHETLREGYFFRWCHLLHWQSSMNYDETEQTRHLSFSHRESWRDEDCVLEGSIVLLFALTRKFSFIRIEGSSRSIVWTPLGAMAKFLCH